MTHDVFTWLHLTDLHWGLRGQDCLWPTLRQPFFDDLGRVLEKSGPVQAVLFTGDLVQSGESEQFTALETEFLSPLWTRLAEVGSGKVVLLAVPGNHDLNRNLKGNAALAALRKPERFEEFAQEFWQEPSCDYRLVIRDAFGAYSQWWEGHKRRPEIVGGILPGDFACTLNTGGHSVGIVGLNTTFLQLAAEDYKGRLAWNARQVHTVCNGAVDEWCEAHALRLLLTHQGPAWLSPAAQRHGETEVAPAGRFAMHLFGHMHDADLTSTRRGASQHSVRLYQGTSVFGMERWGQPPTQPRLHGYTVGQVSFQEVGPVVRLWPRRATNKTGPWRYVPDHESAHLCDDGGTEPESLGRTGMVPRLINTTLAAVPPLRPNPHSTLPSRQPFFGRIDELAMVARTLQPNHLGWGVVLDGPGGIGKTALALEAAHRAPGEHFPLKLFVSAKVRRLHPHGEHEVKDNHAEDYQALLLELGRALARPEVERVKAEERATIIRHALSEHHPLLVLDNLESLPSPDRRRLYDFLEILPHGCKAIVTSRRREDTSARILRLDKLSRSASDELLETLGTHAPTIARLTDSERSRLHAETGGNPLLLTWTASQLGRARGRCQSVDQAIERLRQAHALEKVDERNDPLEFVYGDLLDTFSAEELQVLSALTWFVGPAKLAWILPLTTLSHVAAETALDELRDRALLGEDEVDGTWWLPPLAALYIRRKRPEVVEAAGLLLDKEAYETVMLYGGSAPTHFTRLESTWPTLEAALPRFLAGGNRTLQAVCYGLEDFLLNSGRWAIYLHLAEEAERSAAAAGDAWTAGVRSYDQAWVHSIQGDVDALGSCIVRCEAHWKGATSREEASILALKAIEHGLRGNYVLAESTAQQVLLIQRVRDPRGSSVASAMGNLSNILLAAGKVDAAEALLKEAMALFRALGSEGSLGLVLGNLADIHLARDDWEAAETLAREALSLNPDVERIDVIGVNHHRLARVLLAQGRAADALPHALQAVDSHERLNIWEIRDAPKTLAACEAMLGTTEPPAAKR